LFNSAAFVLLISVFKTRGKYSTYSTLLLLPCLGELYYANILLSFNVGKIFFPTTKGEDLIVECLYYIYIPVH